MNKNDIGDKIASIIKEHNLTQKEFAKKIDITESALTRYIKNERTPRIDVLNKISKEFNISLDDLMRKETKKDDYFDLKALLCRNAKNLSDAEKIELINILSNNNESK